MTRSKWAFEISGPISTSSPAPGSPTTSVATSSTSSSANSSATDSWTSTRQAAPHSWPEFQKPAARSAVAAAARSASGKMTTGALPPSSRWTRLSDSAAARATALPLRTEPVSAIMVDVGVLGEPGADHRAVAGHDVEHAGRQDVGDELGELQRGERGLLRRLDDQGVAGGQDGRHLPGGHQQRVVPRGHDADDAQRLAQDDRQVVLGVVARGRGGRRAQRPGHEAERVDGLGHVVLRDRGRLAGVGRLQPGEEVGVLGDPVGDRCSTSERSLGVSRAPRGPSRRRRRPPRRRCPRPCPRRPGRSCARSSGRRRR